MSEKRQREGQLDELMQHGYRLMAQRRPVEASTQWLEEWELARRMIRPAMRSSRDVDAASPDLTEFLFHWTGDLMWGDRHGAPTKDRC